MSRALLLLVLLGLASGAVWWVTRDEVIDPTAFEPPARQQGEADGGPAELRTEDAPELAGASTAASGRRTKSSSAVSVNRSSTSTT